MVMGRRGLVRRLAQKASVRLAGSIDKETFLKQLKEQWRPYVKKGSDIDDEVTRARVRINSSDFKEAFDKVGVTDDDLKRVLKELQDEKPEQVINKTRYIGRNDPCPCGSGKKYKKCHGG